MFGSPPVQNVEMLLLCTSAASSRIYIDEVQLGLAHAQVLDCQRRHLDGRDHSSHCHEILVRQLRPFSHLHEKKKSVRSFISVEPAMRSRNLDENALAKRWGGGVKILLCLEGRPGEGRGVFRNGKLLRMVPDIPRKSLSPI